MVKTQYICHIMLFLFIRLAEMASVYKNSRRVTVRGQLRCGGHPLRNAIASVVAQTPDRAFTLNDGATDSTGHYSLEATYFPAIMGDGSVEFKVQFVHDCSDSKEENRTKQKLRRRHRPKSNRTVNKRASVEVQDVSSTSVVEPIPNEYVYDGSHSPIVFEYSVDFKRL
ncbi:hypothetical protein AAVH_08264 [Aphelenchoides avenae]|nr:hypothetical protein AAVH_08264 [Aphelenchus avenae]